MSLEYPCVYYKPGGLCEKYSTDGITSYCVQGPCPDQSLSNSDRIRAMDDEELLDFMKKSVANAYMCKIMRIEPMFLTLEWLQQPAEEGK
jgi:hypothetical protein